jgi:WD40 repeat protein
MDSNFVLQTIQSFQKALNVAESNLKIIQTLEERLKELERAFNRSGLKNAIRVTGAMEVPRIDRLEISAPELIETYNNVPQVFAPSAIPVTVTSETYRGLSDSAVLEINKHGSYWIIANTEETYWLVPNITIRLNPYRMKTLAMLFTCRDESKANIDKFTLIEPAQLKMMPNQKEWHLVKTGILQFGSASQLNSEQDIKNLDYNLQKLQSNYETLTENIERLLKANEQLQKDLNHAVLNRQQIHREISDLHQAKHSLKKNLLQLEESLDIKLQQVLDQKAESQMVTDSTAPSQEATVSLESSTSPDEISKENNIEPYLEEELYFEEDKSEDVEETIPDEVAEDEEPLFQDIPSLEISDQSSDEIPPLVENHPIQQPVRILEGHSSTVKSLVVTPLKKDPGHFSLLSASFDNTIRIWNPLVAQEIGCLNNNAFLNSIALSPDARMIVGGGQSEVIKLWNLNNSQKDYFEGHSQSILDVALSPDGNYLVSGSRDTTIIIRDFPEGTIKHHLKPDNDLVLSVTIDPMNSLLATGHSTGVINLWELQQGILIDQYQQHYQSVWSLGFSQDSNFLASVSSDKTLKVWDIANCQLLYQVSNEFSILAVAISGDGQYIATGDSGHQVKIFNFMTGEELVSLMGHTKEVYALVFSPDNRYLLSGGRDTTIAIWQVPEIY